jgi:hypothetical protein
MLQLAICKFLAGDFLSTYLMRVFIVYIDVFLLFVSVLNHCVKIFLSWGSNVKTAHIDWSFCCVHWHRKFNADLVIPIEIRWSGGRKYAFVFGCMRIKIYNNANCNNNHKTSLYCPTYMLDVYCDILANLD